MILLINIVIYTPQTIVDEAFYAMLGAEAGGALRSGASLFQISDGDKTAPISTNLILAYSAQHMLKPTSPAATTSAPRRFRGFQA
jgi:hypothetical protein